MQDVVEERNPAEDQENPTQPTFRFGPIQQSQEDHGRSECHQQVVERRRIFQSVEERNHTERQVRLKAPRTSRMHVSRGYVRNTVSVSVDCTKYKEKCRSGDP